MASLLCYPHVAQAITRYQEKIIVSIYKVQKEPSGLRRGDGGLARLCGLSYEENSSPSSDSRLTFTKFFVHFGREK